MSAATAATDIDVSALPQHALGARSPLWWGGVLADAIEATMMGLVLVSFLYVRGNFEVWPPVAMGSRVFYLALVQALFLWASFFPMWLCNQAARNERLRWARFLLVVTTVMGAAVLVLRGFELFSLPFRWDANAHASLFWMALGLHTFHILTSVVENSVLSVLLFVGPVEKKHFEDVQVSAILWFFVVLEWVAGFAVLYLLPIFRPR